MRRLIYLAIIALLGGGGWYLWNYEPSLRHTVEQYIDNGDLTTVKARYTANQIMDAHRHELLEDSQHTFQDPILKFYPYLLLDVKYVQADKKTKEGFLLWSLTNGEIVLDSETWEQTHGFEDAINGRADRNDFKVMRALAKNGGSFTREQLQKELHLEMETLAPWLASLQQKHLVVHVDDSYQLHFQNPKINVTPITRLKQPLVSKSNYQAQKASKKYSRSQIEKIAQAAFGPSFTIRNAKEAYLPVYAIGILNPDGTTHLTYWNAVNGVQILE